MKKNFKALALTLIISHSQNVFSAPLPQLNSGMTNREVRLAWGAPLEVDDKETARERIWRYAGDKIVRFREGRVVSWSAGEALPIEEVIVQEASATPSVQIDGESLDIVRDIARELPAGSDSPSSLSPADLSAPLVPQAIQPAPVIAAAPMQQGMVGGFHGGMIPPDPQGIAEDLE